MTTIQQRSAAAAGEGSEQARRAMIDSQLRTSGVSEPWVLTAMMRVPREDFVPEPWRAAAYIDRAVPLGEGRFLAAPIVHGRMLSEAAPDTADRALLVGDGHGYLAALLKPLVGSLDVIAPGAAADPAQADGHTLLLIDGAVEQVPAALAARLAEGGRVVAGLVERGVTRLASGRKTAGRLALVPLAEMGIPVLPEFAAPRRWSF